jgi:branched-chain amino acid transport system permease protein
MKKGLNTGLIAFAILTYVTLIGLPTRLEGATQPVLALLMALFFFAVLRSQAKEMGRAALLQNGLIAGLVAGLLLVLEIGFFNGLLADGVKIQPVFDKIVPLNMAALLNVRAGAIIKGETSVIAYAILTAYLAVAGLAGSLLVLFARSGAAGAMRSVRIPGGRWLVILLPFALFAFIYYLGLNGVSTFGNDKNIVRLLLVLVATGAGLFALAAAKEGVEKLAISALLAAVLLSLPFVLNQFQNSVMSIVFIFVMMGLGLNIVVGYAGLLDLGYVAFFAIGAYVYAFVAAPFSSPYISALLTGMGISPASPLLGYWSAIPLAMLTAAIGGVLLGIPVLRLRGDYLAIVTLGFGEIIRLFMLNLGDLTNGPRGLLQIAQPTLFGVAPASLTTHLDAQGWIFLLAIFGSALVAFVAIRLNDSRLGRAWVAMREDEDVAQATGIHLVQTKLLAFAIGATFAGLAGQLYAARQINIFPENFSLFVSIDALALIIVGGMGSIPGVVLGALALKGLPEVLRGVDEYRIVTFAILLIVMMIVRPEGILPSARRRRELHSEEVALPDEDEKRAELEGRRA